MESGAVLNDRGTAERRNMQIGANLADRGYVPYGGGTRAGYARENGKKPLVAVDIFSRQSEQKEESTDNLEFIRSRMDEILEKVKKGKTEPVIQTGAQAFSEKEWDRLLEQFDSAEDALKEMMREEHAKRLKEQINKAEIMNDMDKEAEKILTSQSTVCTLPSEEAGKGEARYIT